MSLQNKVAMAGDKPLRDIDMSVAKENIVTIRQPTDSAFLAKGYTLVYFMDSPESAAQMRVEKLPYLMVPSGTFYSGGNPITDIWKKKFQSPGTEHILGVLQGHTEEDEIYIDMMTVRTAWRRNHITSLMIDALKKSFPNAKLTFSSPTNDGEKFIKGYSKP